MTRLQAFAALSLSLLAACGASEDALLDVEEIEELEAEARISYDYTCTGIQGHQYGPVAFALRSSKLAVTLDLPAIPNLNVLTGTYDPSYSPRSAANREKVRYKFEKICAEGACTRIYEILLDRSMRSGGAALRSGGKGGFATLRVKTDTFGEVPLLCRRVTGGGTPASPTVTVEGVRFTAAEGVATLRAANEATAAQLRAAKVAARATTNIVAGRTYASLESLAAVAYVGKAALTALKKLGLAAFAGAAPPPTRPSSAYSPEEQAAVDAAHRIIGNATDLTVFEGSDPDRGLPGLDRLDVYGGFGNGGRVHDGADELDGLFLVIGFYDRRTFVDVFYDNTWLDHGMAEQGDPVHWAGRSAAGLNHGDPTMCACRGESMWTCTGVDGSVMQSTTMMCD